MRGMSAITIYILIGVLALLLIVLFANKYLMPLKP